MAQVTGLETALAGKSAANHNHDAVSTPRRSANVVVVAADGSGDFTSSVDAMNAIVDAGEAKPYLVKIMPGVYNIGSGLVAMKAYVDIKEARGRPSPGSPATTSTHYPEASAGMVMGANNAELRSLTIDERRSGKREHEHRDHENRRFAEDLERHDRGEERPDLVDRRLERRLERRSDDDQPHHLHV